ncbi:MAG: homoserine kinase [Nitrospirae bacterium]|nr:homoserine kinase [Candidatus Troglogloeales bacterium]
MKKVCVFAPASIGNIGPGFDLLGMAIAGMGDTVIATRKSQSGVTISKIIGNAPSAEVPNRPDQNTAGIAAHAVLSRLHAKDGVDFVLRKGVLGTGVGSSAASAVAAAYATNLLFGKKLTRAELIPLAAVAESKVSGGFFLDNIGPSMMGGVTWNNLITKEVVPLGVIAKAIVIIAVPDFPLLTRESRKQLPTAITMEQFISNMAYASMMAWAVAKKDVTRFGQAIHDIVAEPVRAPLIKGFDAVKKGAIGSGALGCSIAGAGASVFAITDDAKKASKIGAAMLTGFGQYKVTARIIITTMDRRGVRKIASQGMLP